MLLRFGCSNETYETHLKQAFVAVDKGWLAKIFYLYAVLLITAVILFF